MQHFCIITNGDKNDNAGKVQHIRRFLTERGCSCLVLENQLWCSEGIRHFTNVEQIPEETECAIVLGGDGTIIQAAIDLVHRDLPILGINTGNLGFLTEVEENRMDEGLNRLIADDFRVESRMMLKEQKMFRRPESASSCYALNDMVISKRGDCRLITVRVLVNDKLADVYRADGLIVSTPTGSTGYNLSAGGPVMSPNTHAMVVTPICAHSLNKRSLVLDAADKITLQIGQTKEVGVDQAVFTVDGRNVGNLTMGDELVIQVPEADTKLVKLADIGFFERMRGKLNGD